MSKEEAERLAHEMYAYEISEQADENTGNFDDLWQSIYDVLQIATYGIVDMDIVKHFCSQWVSCQGQERLLEYLNAIEEDKKNLEFFLSFLGSFEDWLKELFVSIL